MTVKEASADCRSFLDGVVIFLTAFPDKIPHWTKHGKKAPSQTIVYSKKEVKWKSCNWCYRVWSISLWWNHNFLISDYYPLLMNCKQWIHSNIPDNLIRKAKQAQLVATADWNITSMDCKFCEGIRTDTRRLNLCQTCLQAMFLVNWPIKFIYITIISFRLKTFFEFLFTFSSVTNFGLFLLCSSR